jgi:hypothetical protein
MEMKKPLFLVLTLSFLLLMSVTASARSWHKDYDHDRHWQPTHHNDIESERGLPFSWHENFKAMKKHYQLERMEDREWSHRFPGLHAYKWSNHEGFWHHGHYVQDAVFFYDDHHELVSIGYMADGVFVYFRDDHESFENHDSFFFSWFHR